MSSAQGNILIVDDVADNREMLARRLGRKGYTTTTADDGFAAVELINSQRFDLVLLDIRMPRMSGLEVLAAIRSKFNKSVLPVLIVSGETDSSDVVKALKAGANDYITKPMDFPVALARIEGLLALRQEVENAQTTVLSAELLPVGYELDGRYRIEAVVGEGGFAIVYKAVQLNTGQVVAVKVLRVDRIADRRKAAEEVARFQQEMHLIAKVRHPNIVQLIDSGQLQLGRTEISVEARSPMSTEPTRIDRGGQKPAAEQKPRAKVVEGALPYLVMEFLEGENLETLLKREGSMTPADVLDIVLPLLSGLAVAHAHGIIHRDLKPPNIYLTRGADGQVSPKILDFGIAKLVRGGTSDMTRTAAIIGTPDYMSPEQARSSTEITWASDLYTICTVVYECLVGAKPYHSTSLIDLLQKVARGQFTPIREHGDAVPEELAEVIERGLALDVDDRHASLGAFARALLPFASDGSRSRWAETFRAAES